MKNTANISGLIYHYQVGTLQLFLQPTRLGKEDSSV